MALDIPEDVLHLILHNTPIAVSVVDGQKHGWEFIKGFSLASHQFRQLALKRWYSTLRIHDERDWEYLYTHVWISQLVRELYCSSLETWRDRHFKDPSALWLKGIIPEVMTEFIHLQAVTCDMHSAWIHFKPGEFLTAFTQGLPSTVGSVTLINSPVISALPLVSVIRNLPNLRVLDLGTCTVHCPCASCTRLVQDLSTTISSRLYLPHTQIFEYLKFAAETPPHKHLQKMTFNVHLTHAPAVMFHRKYHDRQRPMAECTFCPVTVAEQTLELESAAAMAFAKALPALKTVEWCSWFCKNGRREFTIHRGEGNTNAKITLEADC